MKLNKLLCVMIALFAINTGLYAVEISVGASFGAGMPIFRGTNATDMIKAYDDYTDQKKTTFALVPQINVMVEFLPFLALETGLGFKYSTLKYAYKNSGTGYSYEQTTAITRSEIFIPVMLRGQFEYSLGVTYVSAGVKLGIPTSAYMTMPSKTTIGNTVTEIKGDDAILYKSSPFTLDIAFALGQEFRIATSHYVGIRVGYDLNVIRPYATSSMDNPKVETMLDDADWFQDDFTVALTYRYAFGRK